MVRITLEIEQWSQKLLNEVDSSPYTLELIAGGNRHKLFLDICLIHCNSIALLCKGLTILYVPQTSMSGCH